MVVIQGNMKIEEKNGIRDVTKNNKTINIKVGSYEYMDGLLIENFVLFIDNAKIVEAERHIFPLYNSNPDVAYKNIDKLLNAIREYLCLDEDELNALKMYFRFKF